MALTVKQILVKLGADTKEVDSALDKTGKKTKDFGDKFADLGKKIAGVVSVALITKFFKDSAAQAINAEETFSKFGVVFKSSIGGANEALEDLKTNYGLSGVAAADMMSSTGDLLTGLGATSATALDLSTKTQKLAVDLASFTNYSGGAAGASVALTKAMLGEREMLKGLGIVIQEKMVQERLAAEGKDKLTGASLLAAKAEVTLKLAMEQSKNAIGDYARTSDSAANQIRLLQNSFQDFQVEVGKSITQNDAFKNAFKSIIDLLKDPAFIEAVSDIGSALASLIGGVVPIIGGVVKGLVTITSVAIDAAEKIGTAIRNIPGLEQIITGWEEYLAVLTGVRGEIEDRQIKAIQEQNSQFEKLNNTLIALRDKTGVSRDVMNQLTKEFKDIQDPLDLTRAKINALKFGLLAREAQLTEEQISKIVMDFRDIKDPAERYQKILIAIASGKYDDVQAGLSNALKTTSKEFTIITEEEKKKLAATEADAKATEKLNEETKKQRDAFEKLASSMKILTAQGYQEQSKEIGSLLKLYDQKKEQIQGNEEVIKKWIERIEELSKTALPEEKVALENTLTGLENLRREVEVNIPVWQKETAAFDEFAEFAEPINTDILPDMTVKFQDTEDAVKETTKQFYEGRKSGDDLSATFTSLSTTVSAAFSAIEKLGINLGALPEIIGGVTSGLNSIGSGINAIANAKGGITGALSALSGGFSIATGVISAFSSVLKLLSGKSGELEEAERRLQGLTGTTGDWNKKIEELAKSMGGANTAGRAFNALLADIIRSSDITIGNFDQYITKTREIVSAYEQGNASIEETQKNFGNAFQAMLESAQKLGLEGGAAMTGLILEAKEFGLNVKEINDYINSEMKTGLAGWQTSLTVFGGYSIDVYQNMIDLQKKIADNQELVDAIRGADAAMMGLANSGQLNETQFGTFQQIAVDAMQRLESSGFSVAQAMESDAGLRGMLQNIIFLSEQYGFKVDDATQALIDQGVASGALTAQQKSDSEIMQDGFRDMTDAIRELSKAIRGDLGGAFDYISSSATNTANGVRNSMGIMSGAVRSTIGDVTALGDSIGVVDDEFKNSIYGSSIVDSIEIMKRAIGEATDMTFEMGESIIPAHGKWVNSSAEMNERIEGIQDRISELTDKISKYGKNVSDVQKIEKEASEAELASLTAALEKRKEVLNISEELAGTVWNKGSFESGVSEIFRVFDALGSGLITTKEAMNEIGSSFDLMIGEAERLGIEGSASILSLVNASKSAGLNVPEISGYISDQLGGGISALGSYLSTFMKSGEIKETIAGLQEDLAKARGKDKIKILEGIAKQEAMLAESTADVEKNFQSMGTYTLGLFNSLVSEGASFNEAMSQMGPQLSQLAQIARDNGIAVSGPLKKMLDMQSVMDKYPELMTRIDATSKMLQVLGNTGYLTRDILNQSGADTISQFDAIYGKTGNAKMAYQMLVPTLDQLWWYAKQNNLTLDEHTKKLIADAEASGVQIGKTIPVQEKQLALWEAMAKKMGVAVPYNNEGAAESYGEVDDSISALSEDFSMFIDDSLTGWGVIISAMQPYIDKIKEINELSGLSGGIYVPGIGGVTVPGGTGASNYNVSNVTQGANSRTIYNNFDMQVAVNPDLYALARQIKTIIENDTEGVRTQMEGL